MNSIMDTSGMRWSARAKGEPWSWRAVDLITLAVLGVALGVAFWGFDQFVYPWLNGLTVGFPPAGELLLGVWILPAVVGMLLVRRPGAALLTEFAAANVEMLLGQKWGALVLLSALLQALGVEIVAALWRWRRFDLTMAMLGGALGAVLEIVPFEWAAYVPEYSLTWKLVYLIAGVLSGAVISGLGGAAVVRGLVATGSLNAFPPGEEALVRKDPVHGAQTFR